MHKQAKDCRLGALLVGMGVIDETELRAMLSLQAQLRAHHPSCLPGIVDKRFRLGALLVKSGIIDEKVLEDAMARRNRMLAQAALASAALSAVMPAATAGDTTHVSVAATVLARAAIESAELPGDVAITQQDLERGYIDLDPVLIGLQSNHPAGVRLRFEAASAQFDSVQVEGGGPTLFLLQPGRGLQRQRVLVRLRLRLAPGAAPGRIASPVSVVLAPG